MRWTAGVLLACGAVAIVFTAEVSEPGRLFSLLHDHDQVDLVLGIEATFAMGRENFYQVAKRLGYDLVRHHLWLNESRVRLAMFTFSELPNITVDNIGANSPVSKCDLLRDWNLVRYHEESACADSSKARRAAYDMAEAILQEGREDALQVVVLIAAPVCFPLEEEERLRNNSVHIFNIELEYVSSESRQRESPLWAQALRETPPVLSRALGGDIEMVSGAHRCQDDRVCDRTTGFVHCSNETLRSCSTSSCFHGGTCYDDANGQYAVCICPWGYTGRDCETTENLCEVFGNNACHSRCSPGVNMYECRNHKDSNPENCTNVSPNCTEEKESFWKYVAVGVPVGLVVLFIFGASIYACYAICCAPDREERQRRVVTRVASVRRAVRSSMSHLRPALPPKRGRPNGGANPSAQTNGASSPRTQPVPSPKQDTPLSTILRKPTELPPAPRVPLMANNSSYPPSPPLPSPPTPNTLAGNASPRFPVLPRLPPAPPREDDNLPPPNFFAPPVPHAAGPPLPARGVVQLRELEKSGKDFRESTTDPTEDYAAPPEDYGSFYDDDYDEFDDFYDYAWKTGNLPPPSKFTSAKGEMRKPLLPNAPQTRPDIEHSRGRPVGSDHYGRTPYQHDMLAWQNYVCDLTDSGDGRDLDRVCIIQTDSARWISSDNSLRPTADQLAAIWQVFHEQSTKAEIRLGEVTVRSFNVKTNDGLILTAEGGKGGRTDEALAAARTKQFVVLGGMELSKDHGQCREEVDYIRLHLNRAEAQEGLYGTR